MKSKLQKCFHFLIIGTLSLAASAFAANRPKTVCSITINSDDEIKTYRSLLPSGDFVFRELVTSDKNWLKEACEQGVHCDMVIMSGHFAGSFFGSNGFLSLEEMEAASCNAQCDGVFHNATEVYMYGCNTLAGKNKDHRTPEEYISTLLADGYSLGEAQRIAAFLFSPLGEAFYSRMSKVFAGVPRIYGFDGKAPLGHAVRPRVVNYLKKAAPAFYEALNTRETEENTLYSSAMYKTNATQIAGDSTDDEFPACYINNPQYSQTTKIRWLRDRIIEETLQNKYDTIPLAQYYFRNLSEKKTPLSPTDEALLDDLKNNTEVHKSIAGLKSKLTAMPTTAFQIAQFENIMQWMSDEEFSNVKVQTLIGSDLKTYASGQKDFICSLNIEIDVHLNDIPKSFLSQENFLWALACAKPRDPHLQRLLSEYLVQGPKGIAFTEISHFIANSKTTDPVIHNNLIKAYKNQTDEMPKWFIMHAIRTIPVTDPEIMSQIADELFEVRNSNLGSVLADAIARGAPQDPKTQMRVLNAFVSSIIKSNEYRIDGSDKAAFSNSIAYTINQLRPTNSEVRNAITYIINNYPINQRQRESLTVALNGGPLQTGSNLPNSTSNYTSDDKNATLPVDSESPNYMELF